MNTYGPSRVIFSQCTSKFIKDMESIKTGNEPLSYSRFKRLFDVILDIMNPNHICNQGFISLEYHIFGDPDFEFIYGGIVPGNHSTLNESIEDAITKTYNILNTPRYAKILLRCSYLYTKWAKTRDPRLKSKILLNTVYDDYDVYNECDKIGKEFPIIKSNDLFIINLEKIILHIDDNYMGDQKINIRSDVICKYYRVKAKDAEAFQADVNRIDLIRDSITINSLIDYNLKDFIDLGYENHEINP